MAAERRSSSWQRSEDVCGQLAGRAGQHRLGLGTKGGQLLGVVGGQSLLLSQPADCTLITAAGFFSVSQLVVCHGQEEKVETVVLASPGGQAPLQGRDGLGVLAGTILGDAQRVEGNRLARRELEGPTCQEQRVLGARVDSG